MQFPQPRPLGAPATLVDLLWARESAQPDEAAFTFLRDEDGREDTLTYGQLAARARAIAAQLQEMGMAGERVLILYPSGVEYIAAFFGCLSAGAVAVPAYPPRPNRPLPRVQAILADCGAKAALTTSGILASIERQFSDAPALQALAWLATDQLDATRAADYRPAPITSQSLAFLQYTSGSTGDPKGVMVSHANLLHNLALMRQGLMLPDNSRWVTWLPMYHDMGLIGGILEPMFMGGSSVLLSPAAFLQRPICWLQAISKYRGNISGAPNFAYDLCVDKITPEQRSGLDLSSWRLTVCAAEPVRRDSLRRFVEAFGPCGFSRHAFYPGYGLAECTLQVTGGYGPAEPISLDLDRAGLARQRVVLRNDDHDESAADSDAELELSAFAAGGPRRASVAARLLPPEPDPAARRPAVTGVCNVVGCGRVRLDQQVVIVHPQHRTRCRTDEIGEIWVAGPSVAQGYWNRPDLTADVFHARLADTAGGPFLRTGDLGFFQGGELYVTGRLKDLIIIRGRNHYPQEIELTVERCHPALRAAAGAAFAVDIEREEQLVLIHELDRHYRDVDSDEVLGAIRRAVAEEHEVTPYAVLLIKPYTIAKTSSGKIRRGACREAYLQDRLEVAGRWVASAALQPVDKTAEPTCGSLSVAGPKRTVAQIEHWLIVNLAARLRIAPAEVDLRQPFNSLGLDSVQMVGLIGDLETWLGRKLTATMAWDYPTILLLSRHLAEDPAVAAQGASGEPRPAAEPIAIVGMACRFPGAPDLASYWRLMAEARDAISEIPPDRWPIDDFYDPNTDAPGKMATRWGGFLRDIDRFDPRLFNITPREAARMDPQQRLLLEVAWEAFEHAALAGEQLAGSRTGVFVGIGGTDYSQMYRGFSDYLRHIDAYCGTGNALSIAANRVSYVFDLHGPSLAVDTACSSALVSLHFAVQSLRNRECDMALAGGVNVILSPETTIAFSKARMLSPDGKCRPFDAGANGYVRGEGCGLVVLKRLGDAIHSGDKILALLRGTAVNQDGKSSGLTAPNGPAQQDCIRRALDQAGVSPEQLTYVEAHGTGTPLGDPIEVSALQGVIGQRSPDSPTCYMGSVKANIGHLETASGIASLIRVVLMLEHGAIPPQRNFETLNPNIPFTPSGLQITRELRPWQAGPAARLASISGFGFGGTNAHVVLEESPVHSRPASDANERPLHIATFSAQSQEALVELASRHALYLDEHPELRLADVCHTLAVGRTHLAERLAIAADSTDQLRDRLQAFAQPGKTNGAMRGTATRGAAPKVAFLFTGQGSQYFGMARSLYDRQPNFRHTIDLCDEILRPLVERSLVSVLYDAAADPAAIDQTAYTQPALFAVEYALARLWESWGVKPDALLGHSVGEYPAACLAGVFSLEDGLKLIADRSRRMQQLPRGGRMAAILAGEAAVAPIVARYGNRLSIAAVNGPENVVVSGEAAAVDEILSHFQAADVPCQSLTVSHAFHSAHLDPMLDGFEAFARGLHFQPPQMTLVSNRSGGAFASDEVPDAAYWREHSRQCVQFAQGMAALAESGCEIFIEMGPAPVLLGMGRKCLPEDFGVWLPTLRRGVEDWRVLLSSLGMLHVRGVPVDWRGFDRPYSRTRLSLPTYPFERQRHWMEPNDDGGSAGTGGLDGWCAAAGKHPLLGARVPSAVAMTQFLSDINLARLPFLADHKVQGSIVFPGAGYVELAIAAATDVFGPGSHSVENVNFQQVLFLDEQRPHPVQVVLSPEVGGRCSFQVFHLSGGKPGDPSQAARGAWVLHAEGSVRRAQSSDVLPPSSGKPVEQLRSNLSEELDRAECRRRLASRGLDYGPAFQWPERTWRSDGEAVSQYTIPDVVAQQLAQYHIHPGLLDACIQTIGATVPGDWAPPGSGETFLPVAVRRVRVFGAPQGMLWAHARTRLAEAAEHRSVVDGDLELYDQQGQLLLELQGLKLRRVGRRAEQATEGTIRDWLYAPRWQVAPRPTAAITAVPPSHSDSLAHAGKNGAANGHLNGHSHGHCESPSNGTVAGHLTAHAQNGAQNGHAERISTAATATAEVWLLLVDSQGYGNRLAALLSDSGRRCICVRPEALAGEPAAAVQALITREFPGQRPSCRGVVHLWSLDIPELGTGPGDDRLAIDPALDAAERLGCQSVLDLLQAAARTAWSVQPRLFVVTRGAQTIGSEAPDGALGGIGQSAVWGLGSVIDVEHPELRCTLVDLDPAAAAEATDSRTYDAELADLLAELLTDDQQRQIAHRAGQRYVPRLARLSAESDSGPLEETNSGSRSAHWARPLNVPRQEPFRLELTSPGCLSRLALRPFRRQSPRPGQVEIEVGAAGLNFSDILKAMELYPGLEGGVVPMGIECAGRIAAVGDGVADLRAGDPVIAIAPFSFASHALTEAWAVVPKPDHLTDEEAATIPITFLTAHYGLNRLAHIEPGERVLIHAGAGGVGLAAIQICQARGCEIFATAGSQAKRDFLGSLGVRHVFDSRTLDFAEQILDVTSRQGVDVVLNSLPGEAIPASLSLLRPFGRFLEIGKVDIYQNRLLGMYPFQNNLSFSSIDLDRMIRERPQLVRGMFLELRDQFREHKYEPLPRTVFPVGEVIGAFRYMQQRKNIGKVVVSVAAPGVTQDPAGEDGQLKSRPPVEAADASPVRADGSYLISGGLGALGLQTARWLAGRGAKHLLLAGRGAPTAAAAEAMAELVAAGVHVVPLRADVTDRAQLEQALQTALALLPPLRGVVHAAGLLDDGAMLQLDRDRLSRVLAPKMRGAWNLHRVTQDCPLDFFIMFSSVAPLLGSPGQGNYAAGNAFLDALAHYRRRQGLPALSVNWGPWAEVGMAARGAGSGRLASQGIMPLVPSKALESLEHLLSTAVPQAGVMDIDWPRLGAHYPAGAPSLLGDLIAQPTAKAAHGPCIRADLLAASPDERHELLERYLREQLARVMELEPDKVDPRQPLSNLGIDSLMVIELKNMIEASLGITLPIARFLEGPSVTQLAKHILEALSATANVAETAAPAAASVPQPLCDLPLSYAQQALWVMHQLDRTNTAYNVWDSVRLHGPLDLDRLRRSLQKLVDRHPMLRTTFFEVDGQPRQRVHAVWEVPLKVVNAAGWDAARQAALLQEEVHTPFDLEQGPAGRAVLLRISDEEAIIVFVLHHIVTDLWSLLLAIGEVLEMYRAEASGMQAVLPPPQATYVDFIQAEQETLGGQNGERLLRYWQSELAQPLPVLNLPTDRPRGAVQTFRGSVESLRIDAELTASIKEFSKQQGATVFMTLLAAYQVLLHRHTGQDDILIGSPSSGRNRAAFSGVMGDFINPVVIRGQLGGNPKFRDFLSAIRHKVLAAFDHHEYPFSLLVEKLRPPRDASRPPIFQTLFVMRRAQASLEKGVNSLMSGDFAARLDMADLNVERVIIEPRHAQFDLSCQAGEADEQLSFEWQYNADLFDRATIHRLAAHFRTLLQGIVADPETTVGDLPLLTSAEQRQLIDWNATGCAEPPAETIHGWFEQQAAESPDAVAVSAAGRRLTYGQLNRRANQLARHLRQSGVGPESLVGLALDRKEQMLVGLLGILKAGGAYLPLDPAFPPQRLAAMLADSGATLIVTQTAVRGCLPAQSAHVIDLDADRTIIAAQPSDNLRVPCGADQLAYVLYTSGSTGRPKGVEVPHKAAVNFLNAMRKRPGLTPDDVVLAVTTLSFDIAVLELFLPLVTGARVVLASRDDASDGARLAELIRSERITLLQATPATWRLLLAAGWTGRTGLKMLCGGEALPRDLAAQLLSRGAALWNMYGPTETTVWSSVEEITSPAEPISIGRPIDNTQIYVLDPSGSKCPVGVVGDLVIGGTGVARGYLGQAELTAERFIADPFSDVVGARLYRTGDLGRFLADGRLECLGREDQQVKLRGFRIELGEIEASLCQHPAVREAAVQLSGEVASERRLVAHVVLRQPSPAPPVPSSADLQIFLRLTLPDYMVPAQIVFLSELPRTPNGKLDRRSLPLPEAVAAASSYAAPSTATEREVHRLWLEVLHVPTVGVHDDFFLSGGHSLSAAQLIARMREAFKLDLPLGSLFGAPTVAGIARLIDGLRRGEKPTAAAAAIDFAAESQLDPTIHPAPGAERCTGRPQNVLLTGATGYLGAFLLRELLDRTEAQVYCLVRSADAKGALEKITDNLRAYDIPAGDLAARVVPVLGDLAQPLLGLARHRFEQLAGEIDAIYHNGALVNFVYPYRLLRGSNVLGTQEILRLACQGRVKPVHFISTFSVHASTTRGPHETISETHELPPCRSLHDGYSQSKWVAERLLRAGEERGIPVAIYRPGRITGHSRTGAANTNDFLHTMMLGCVQLGMAPQLDMEIDMTPVDFVSRGIVELSLRAEALGHAFHLVNPRPPHMDELVDWMRAAGQTIAVVPLGQWRSQLLALAEQLPGEVIESLAQVFGPSYGGLEDEAASEQDDQRLLARIVHPHIDCGLTEQLLAQQGVQCPPVDEQLLAVYFRHLRGAGFFPLAQILAPVEPGQGPHQAAAGGIVDQANRL